MKYISKRFLSPDHDETGSIVVRVETDELDNSSRWVAENNAVESEVTFRDCHGKPIYLQFGLDNKHTLEARFEKIDLIINELMELKVQLQRADKHIRNVAAAWLATHPKEKDE